MFANPHECSLVEVHRKILSYISQKTSHLFLMSRPYPVIKYVLKSYSLLFVLEAIAVSHLRCLYTTL